MTSTCEKGTMYLPSDIERSKYAALTVGFWAVLLFEAPSGRWAFDPRQLLTRRVYWAAVESKQKALLTSGWKLHQH